MVRKNWIKNPWIEALKATLNNRIKSMKLRISITEGKVEEMDMSVNGEKKTNVKALNKKIKTNLGHYENIKSNNKRNRARRRNTGQSIRKYSQN